MRLTVTAPLEPSFSPEHQTTCFASAMRRSVAAQLLKMHGIAQTQPAGLVDGVASLVRALVHLKTLSAELKHFRHERQGIKRRVGRQCRENFLFAADFDPISRSQAKRSSA